MRLELRVAPADAGGRRSDVLALAGTGRQGAALPAAGRRSLFRQQCSWPCLTTVQSSPPPSLALNVPCHAPVPCALSWGPGCRLGWGSWGGWPWLPGDREEDVRGLLMAVA